MIPPRGQKIKKLPRRQI